MSRRIADFRGTLAAVSLLFATCFVGNCMSPDGWEPVPRRLLNSDDKFVGWGSEIERACRRVPEVHNFLWRLPDFT